MHQLELGQDLRKRVLEALDEVECGLHTFILAPKGTFSLMVMSTSRKNYDGIRSIERAHKMSISKTILSCLKSDVRDELEPKCVGSIFGVQIKETSLMTSFAIAINSLTGKTKNIPISIQGEKNAKD